MQKFRDVSNKWILYKLWWKIKNDGKLGIIYGINLNRTMNGYITQKLAKYIKMTMDRKINKITLN